jgi:hypothetical protein
MLRETLKLFSNTTEAVFTMFKMYLRADSEELKLAL